MNDSYTRRELSSEHDGSSLMPAAQDDGTAPDVAAAEPRQFTAERQLLAQELDALMRELGARSMPANLSELSPAQVVQFVNETVGTHLPSIPAALLEDVERNLEDASFADFADRDVLRGMALLTYYSLQVQVEPYREPIADRLQHLPGYDLFLQLRQSLEGATLQDLTEPTTWTEFWTVASRSARTKLIELLRNYEEKNGIAE